MKRFVQPTTGVTFTLQPDGTVLAEDPRTSQAGVFSRKGTWISGDLHYVDEVMCEFVGGTYMPPAGEAADQEQDEPRNSK